MAKPKVFDVGRDLIPEVRRLAAQNPDYVYPQMTDDEGGTACFYLARSAGNTAKAACIFGRALRNLGVLARTLRKYENTGITGALVSLVRSGLATGTSAQIAWCQRVQTSQDYGESWSYCVARADRMHGGTL